MREKGKKGRKPADEAQRSVAQHSIGFLPAPFPPQPPHHLFILLFPPRSQCYSNSFICSASTVHLLSFLWSLIRLGCTSLFMVIQNLPSSLKVPCRYGCFCVACHGHRLHPCCEFFCPTSPLGYVSDKTHIKAACCQSLLVSLLEALGRVLKVGHDWGHHVQFLVPRPESQKQ